MRKAIFLALLLAFAQLAPAQNFCDQSVAVTAPAGANTEVIAASANQTVYICGFILTANTASTAVQFMSGTTSKSGIMLTPANGPLAYGDGNAILVRGVSSANFAVSAAVGAVTGIITFGVH